MTDKLDMKNKRNKSLRIEKIYEIILSRSPKINAMAIF